MFSEVDLKIQFGAITVKMKENDQKVDRRMDYLGY